MTRSLTTDAIIFREDMILLVKRKNDPFRGFWALPGGYVEDGETMKETVIREVKEETGLRVRPVKMTGVYDDTRRDKRGNVTVAWLCDCLHGKPAPDSDAADAMFFGIGKLPEKIAFDHKRIIEDAMKAAKNSKKKKVMAGGVFNIIHPGHVYFLKMAKKLGDELVVVVASDSTVLKNGKRLLFPAGARAEIVSSLKAVDRAIIGDEKDHMKIVKSERPDIIALGYDQDENWIEKSLRKENIRCRIVKVGKLKGYSTKKITGG